MTQAQSQPKSRARETIEGLIADHRIMLFMKGSKHFPQCGFSHEVAARIKQHAVDFETYNVLTDPEVRQDIKEFSSWPTIPQLYVGGEFIGGCDIVRELDENGELAKVLTAES